MSSAHGTAPLGSVVVPTRNRPDLLAACLAAIAANSWADKVEVIIVDDGSDTPLTQDIVPAGLAARIVRLTGVGPGVARNIGVERAGAPVILFTDDDTVPAVSWIESALVFLESHPECVGVNGPVRSPKWDPLTEKSIATEAHDHHWTCNVAYRRDLLLSLGGFRDKVFRFAHAEDRDLSLRVRERGTVGFEPGMAIIHTPRPRSLKVLYRQARWVHDDLVLYALHPEITREFSYSPRIGLVVGWSKPWLRLMVSSRSPRRATRALASFLIVFVTTSVTVMRTPRTHVLRRSLDGVE